MNLRTLAERFCAAPLPATVCADPCASMQGYPNRTGTNLLTVVEAQTMLERAFTDALADLEHAKAVLESVRDHMDEFAYQELSSALNP